MIHERKGGHFRRQYSARAKRAGEAMMKVIRDFAELLSVQDARDACTFCRSILESQVRGCPYNDAALEAEEDLDAVANADEPMPKSPTYEETATGYAIAAMRMAELPPDTIQQVVTEMRVMIDKYSPAEAAQIATSSPY